MAVSIGQISATTQAYFMPKAVDNIFNSNVLLQRARNKYYKSVSGGTVINMPLAYAATTAVGWFDGLDTLNTTDNEQMTSAQFNWKHIYGNITIADSDEIQNSGESQIIDFVKSKVQLAEKTVKDTMGTALFNDGTTANAIVGLRAIVDSTTNTYGGISRSSNSWWQPQRNATTTTLSIPAMTSMYGDCKIDNDAPTLIICDQDQWDNYHGLLQPQERFQDEDTAKGGFKNLMFMATPVAVDSHCPSGDMYFLNEEYLSFFYHPDKNFAFEPFRRPHNQAGSYAKIFWSGAFGCNNPRMQGVLTALT